MKTLSNYTQQAQTDLFKKTGSFFAFSNKQFQEGKKEGVKYFDLGQGLICPKGNEKELMSGLKSIQKLGIAKDIEENGKENIIRRELYNYECFYTGEIEDAVDNLKQYGYTYEDVLQVYRSERKKGA